MKKYIFVLLGILCFFNVAAAQESAKWNIEKSTHFIVYYKNTDYNFIRELVNKSEEYYSNIASDLGFNRYNFWLWDNRAKVYIYDNASQYRAATGQPGWSAGYAQTANKVIYTYPYAQGFFETILPHELGHIIFREFVGANNPDIPIWLDEGVACYQERTRYLSANKQLREAIDLDEFANFGKLSGFTLNTSMQDGLVRLLYAKAFSIVDFLIREYGKNEFVDFCRDLRDRKGLQNALVSNYPFKNIQELDSAWASSVGGTLP